MKILRHLNNPSSRLIGFDNFLDITYLVYLGDPKIFGKSALIAEKKLTMSTGIKPLEAHCLAQASPMQSLLVTNSTPREHYNTVSRPGAIQSSCV